MVRRKRDGEEKEVVGKSGKELFTNKQWNPRQQGQ